MLPQGQFIMFCYGYVMEQQRNTIGHKNTTHHFVEQINQLIFYQELSQFTYHWRTVVYI